MTMWLVRIFDVSGTADWDVLWLVTTWRARERLRKRVESSSSQTQIINFVPHFISIAGGDYSLAVPFDFRLKAI